MQKSSGNVFDDLNIARPQVALAKAELARLIIGAIADKGLTQTKAANILGIDQAKVSALNRGRLSGFSTDRLFRFLNALGQDVEIVIKNKPKSRKQARVHVATS